MFKKIAVALFGILALASSAQAQSGCASITTSAVLTAAQWNACFAAKQNVIGYTPLNIAGGSMTGRLVTAASAAGAAGFNLPQGAAPSVPANGDLWTTSAGMFVRINGVTQALNQVFTTAGGDLFGTYPNPSVVKLRGEALAATTPTSGNLLVGSGSDWSSRVVSGDGTLSGLGVLAVTKINGVTLGSTTAIAGNILVGSGTAWVTQAVTGDLTLGAGGVATVTRINGATLGTATAISGNLLIGSGSAWVTQALSGDVTLASSGAATVARINGVALGSTAATSGNVLIGSGTNWVTRALSGDATISSTGVVTVARVNGVTISGTPAAGNVIVATGATTAIWRNFIPVTYVTKTADYPVVSADCGDGFRLATNFFTFTVPDPSTLTAGCVISATNVDTAPGRGKRMVIFGKTAYNLMAGQSVTLSSTGTAWIESIPGPQRWRPLGISNIAFYVSTAGSLSGDGLGGCAGAPFDDNPNAFDYVVQNVDVRNMDPVAIVSCGGTYTGAAQGVHAASNVAYRNGDLGIMFTGPLTSYDGLGTCIDPAAVVRSNPVGAPTPLYQPELSYSAFAVGCQTLTSLAAQPLLNPDRGSSIVIMAGLRLGNVPNGTAQIAIAPGSQIRQIANLTVTGGAGTNGYFLNTGGIWISAGFGITFDNGLSTPNVYNTTVFASQGSVSNFGAFTIPNGVTGKRFALSNSTVNSPTGVYSPTFIPGSTPGTMTGNSSIDEYQNPNFPNLFIGTLGSGTVTAITPAMTVYAPLFATGPAIAIRQSNNVAFGSDIYINEAGSGETNWYGVFNNTKTLGFTIARDGTITHSQATTLSAALTYGGVTLSNAVTGTGAMVLATSPTVTGLRTNTLNITAIANVATTSAVCVNPGTGLLTYNGTVGTCTVSVLAAKNVIAPLTDRDGFDLVMSMDPYRYTLKDDRPTYIPGEQIGFIADWVKDRRVVASNEDGSIAGVRYEQYTAALTSAVRYLAAQNDNLRAANDNLRAGLDEVKSLLSKR